MGAVTVVVAHLVTASWTTAVLRFFFRLVDDVGCDNAGRNGNDGVAKEHDECRKQASYGGYWCDVAIADGGHRDDSPIDGRRQIGEFRVRMAAFNHIHQRAQTSDEYEYEQEID